MSHEYEHVLERPIVFDGQEITAIGLPRMKGKYHKKFKIPLDGHMETGALLAVVEAMLSDEYGLIKARFITDEMGPYDVNEVCAKVGEWLAGGQRTGAAA